MLATPTDVNSATTKIYAYADIEMKLKALEKSNTLHSTTDAAPVWQDNENMILCLSRMIREPASAEIRFFQGILETGLGSDHKPLGR